MTTDPRINITYDFEGDDDDVEDYERWLRRMHPVEEYPYFDGEDGNHVSDCWFGGGYSCFFATGKFCHFDHTRRCCRKYLLNRTNPDNNH